MKILRVSIISLVWVIFVFAFSGLTSSSLQASPAAPTFTVNSPVDAGAGGSLTNGVCQTTPSNSICTLRAAIMKANHYPGGGVTINLPAGTYGLTILPDISDDETNGDLNITKTMTINGAGAASTIIDANQIDRVLNVAQGATVNISNVTIRNGLVNDTGGGIRNYGTLILNSVVISGNQSGSNSAGGGIANEYNLTLNNSMVINNAGGNAGGIYNDSTGTVILNHSAVSHNEGQAGGYGGGIGTSGVFILNQSLVDHNQTDAGSISTDGQGGGIANFAGVFTSTNSTISNNSARGDGGGVLNWGKFVAYYTTIAGNLADNLAAGSHAGGGILNNNGGVVNLRATLIGQNYTGAASDDCNGTVTSQDYNLIQTTSGCTVSGVTTHNITGLDPAIDSLHNNGGSTNTRALFYGSPAINAIPTAQCTDQYAAPMTIDQRGSARPIGGACDIGAYEGNLPQKLIGVNLIRNGDAEGSAGSPDAATVGHPYWLGSAAVVPYGITGGFPSITDTGPINRGFNFFAGGYTNYTELHQFINLQPYSAAIKSGAMHCTLSGYFGGFANQSDTASAEAVFYDKDNYAMSYGLVQPSVTAADRGNATGLLFRSASGVLPSPTITIEVALFFYNNGAPSSYDDGYADNLSLTCATETYLPLVLKSK